MKTLCIKMVTGCLLFTSVVGSSFGQAPMVEVADGGKMPAKLEKDSVPKIVIEKYIIEYPVVVNDSWYGYPAFIEESDWYGYDSYLYTTNHPEYYVVEFTKEETPHKIMYSKAGKKIATHKKFITDLPKAVSEAIGKSKYKSWIFVKDNEEILKESDKKKVYKVIVKKGTEKHALYFEPNGNLVKDKKLRS